MGCGEGGLENKLGLALRSIKYFYFASVLCSFSFTRDETFAKKAKIPLKHANTTSSGESLSFDESFSNKRNVSLFFYPEEGFIKTGQEVLRGREGGAGWSREGAGHQFLSHWSWGAWVVKFSATPRVGHPFI